MPVRVSRKTKKEERELSALTGVITELRWLDPESRERVLASVRSWFEGPRHELTLFDSKDDKAEPTNAD